MRAPTTLIVFVAAVIFFGLMAAFAWRRLQGMDQARGLFVLAFLVGLLGLVGFVLLEIGAGELAGRILTSAQYGN